MKKAISLLLCGAALTFLMGCGCIGGECCGTDGKCCKAAKACSSSCSK